ncbi:hypothetical protein ACQ26G_001571 [Yersinia enterocolitica]|uniref:hypothetical protein n=1 Tax=Yersinia enterocolitica TaxID=630 RepID=UPI0029AD5D4D|nr:hypothetical protein [Yersinia enterocolitica]
MTCELSHTKIKLKKRITAQQKKVIADHEQKTKKPVYKHRPLGRKASKCDNVQPQGDKYSIKQILGIQGQRKGVVIATKKQAKVECTRVPSANGWKVYLKARKTKAPENISV